MTKNKFLKELDKSLYVLAEVERNDIIDEYRDIIEEKIKHGKTEKEAVEEFGSIDELAREILSVYKVNPDYSKKEDNFGESTRKLGSDFDSFVKKGARKATEITKEIVDEIKQSDNEITIEFVFELLFKGFATLIIMFIASIPFTIIREIGSSILDNVLPIGGILVFVWTLLITVLYIGCCGLIFIAMFKQYFTKKDINTKKEKVKENNTDVLDTKTEEKVADVKKETAPKPVVVRKQKNRTPLLDIFLAFAKAILVIMLLPLIFFNIGVGFSIAIVIYLIIKGLAIPGLLILLIGVLLFFGHLQNCIFDVMFKQKKMHFYPLAIAIVFGIIGGIMCFDQALSMNYYDYAPKIDNKEVIKEIVIDSKTPEVSLSYWNLDIETKIDPTLKDNQIKFVTKNYDKLTKINIIDEGVTSDYNNININYITLSSNRINFLSNEQRNVNKVFIKNFNKKKIYNYNKLYNPQVTIYTNGILKVNY